VKGVEAMKVNAVNNVLGAAIKQQADRKAYDRYCKKLLSNKQILAYFFKEYVEEFSDIPLKDIAKYLGNPNQEYVENLNLEDESILGSVIRFDTLFEVRMPKSKRLELFNIEAQMSDYPRISDIEKGALLL